MNIFATSPCPKESAKFLDNKRLVKMCLETTQILCTVINENAGEKITPYKSTHKNHPCVKWAGESQENFFWLNIHAMELCGEYKIRFGKVHACTLIASDLPLLDVEKIEQTPFVNCAANKSLGLDFKHINNVHEAYKQYLKARWKLDKMPPKLIK
jgi:hypothetical protein